MDKIGLTEMDRVISSPYGRPWCDGPKPRVEVVRTRYTGTYSVNSETWSQRSSHCALTSLESYHVTAKILAYDGFRSFHDRTLLRSCVLLMTMRTKRITQSRLIRYSFFFPEKTTNSLQTLRRGATGEPVLGDLGGPRPQKEVVLRGDTLLRVELFR